MTLNHCIIEIDRSPPASESPRDYEYSSNSYSNKSDYFHSKHGPNITTREIPTERPSPSIVRHNTGIQRLLRSFSPNSTMPNVGADGETDSLKWVGVVYEKILGFSIVTRYLAYVLPVAFFIAIPIIVLSTGSRDDTNAGGIRLVGIFIWLEIVWASLWIAKLFSKTLPHIFKFCCFTLNAGTRKYARLLSALQIPISVVTWTIICWATARPIMSAFPSSGISIHPGPDWLDALERVFLASIPAACVLLAEKFLVQLITVDYHRTQFNGKIKESRQMVKLLELLYTASTVQFPSGSPKFASEDFLLTNTILSRVDQSATSPLRLFDGIGRLGTGITSIFGSIANEVTGAELYAGASAHAVVSLALERKVSCEALARRLWHSTVQDGQEALYPSDFERIFGGDEGGQQQLEDLFSVLDKDGNGDISLEEMIMVVVDIGARRKAVAKSLHDVDAAIKTFDHILMIGVIVGAALIYATFFSPGFYANVQLYTTAVLSCSFAFSGTVQEFAGSCIYLFVKHPYDVSDRVLINGTELIVEHICLLYTVFRRADNNQNIQIPNIVNNGNWVENVSRSGAFKQIVTLKISAGTAFEDVEALQEELEAFVKNAAHRRDFSSDVKVSVSSVGDLSCLELKVIANHKCVTNDSVRASRKNKFNCALLTAMRAVPINGPGGCDAALGDRNKATYSVAISEQEAREAREKFLGDQEAARLINRKKEKEEDKKGL